MADALSPPVGDGGVYAALITPLDESEEIDADALSRLVAELIDVGVDGICPIGSTGEGPLLGPERRAQVVDLVCQLADGRMPVVPTASHTDVPSAIAELERFADLGATAALVTAPPFYAFGPAELTRFFHQIADDAPLPILLYDVPAFAGVQIGAGVAAELARHDNIVGLKDSSGDEANLRDVLKLTDPGEFSVYCGSELLFATAATLGAAGVIGGSINIAPTLVGDLWRAAAAAKPGAEALQARLTELARACRAVGRPFGWKAAAAELGRCKLQYCSPVPPPTPPALDQLRRTMARVDVTSRVPTTSPTPPHTWVRRTRRLAPAPPRSEGDHAAPAPTSEVLNDKTVRPNRSSPAGLTGFSRSACECVLRYTRG